MKKTLLSLTILAAGFGMISCAGGSDVTTHSSSADTTKNVITETTEEVSPISKDVDAETFKSLIDGGAGLILDVRTPGEYAGGNIAGSVNMDFNSAEFEASLDTLDKTKPVYVYCQGGGRSGQAKNIMLEKGFTEVYNLIGGYGNWPYKQ
jgi:rhodanese-related sulfurtransferase